MNIIKLQKIFILILIIFLYVFYLIIKYVYKKILYLFISSDINLKRS